MSDEQFDASLKAARTGEIAQAMRHLQDVSVWAHERLIIEKLFALINIQSKAQVKEDQFEDYAWTDAANDERFALAA
ncbi:hypothetical protein [Paenacidovorax caeni]|nr:hypothetical protein [Paenacidovorax caeni]